MQAVVWPVGDLTFLPLSLFAPLMGWTEPLTPADENKQGAGAEQQRPLEERWGCFSSIKRGITRLQIF